MTRRDCLVVPEINKTYSNSLAPLVALIRGVLAVLFIEVSSFQGVLIRGAPAVLFIEVSSFQGVLIRGVPAVLFIEGSLFLTGGITIMLTSDNVT